MFGKKVITLLGAVTLLVFSGCFSDWTGDGGMGTLDLEGIRRIVNIDGEEPPFDIEDPNRFLHEIRLIDSDGAEVDVNYPVPAGTYTLRVEARSEAPVGFPLRDGQTSVLRAIGIEEAVIEAGRRTPVIVTMQRVLGIETGAQLTWALTNLPEELERLVIAEDFPLSSTVVIPSGANVTIGAVDDRTITRGSGFRAAIFSVEENATFTLETMGDASLTIDAASTQATNGSIVHVAGNGSVFYLHDNVTLANNVMVTGGSLPWHGNYGGGVWVQRGTFNMLGGVISGNTAVLGGGVSVVVGEFPGDSRPVFNMSGGVISGNTASGWQQFFGFGGGVHVYRDFEFSKTGGIIYGADGGDYANNVVRTTGGGVLLVRCHAVHISDMPRYDWAPTFTGDIIRENTVGNEDNINWLPVE